MTMEHFPDVPEEEPNELLFINCLNLVLLLGAAFVTVGIGQYGLFGFATIEHVSAIYPTLVTAPQWAMLSTTFVMIVCLLIWATAQIFPAFRLKARDGIKHYFVGVALLQIVWVLTFAYQLILLSLFAAVAILIFVGLALHDQDKLQQEQTRSDYLVLKFPFVYLFGYEMYIALWTLCIVLVDASVSDTAQYWVALLALIIMTIASFGCMLCDDYTISCVQSYIMVSTCECNLAHSLTRMAFTYYISF